ncbi:hypothetical protein F66182_6153 [Fusarium sp. NRRL 66182]|nr:hypothetical protein F66182_6153 [Fusarium sp. NRRL 66182]
MIPSSITFMQLSLATLTSLPAVLGLGCYSSGPTWFEVSQDHDGYYNTASLLCGEMGSQFFYPGDERAGCLAGSYRHLDWKIRYNGKKQHTTMDPDDCKTAVQIEMYGCEHGSEQNHGDWWYHLDPNPGKDW